jgi:phage-related protein
MIIEQLELAFDKIRQLPEERQAAAVQALKVIAAQEDPPLTDAEIRGVKLAKEAVRRGEYASEDAVRSFFARFRA